MKIIKIFSLIAALAFVFSSCETEVDDPAGLRGEAAVPGITNLNPATFDVNDLENTYVHFDIVLNDPAVNEAIVVVSYKGDKKRAEVAKVSSFPATLKISLVDVVSKLGLDLSSVEAADVFNFEVKTVQGGKSYFSSAAFNVAVVCGYDVDGVTGSYRVISEDWNMDGAITITADPDDPYTVYVSGLVTADGEVEDLGPLKMVVNPLNFSVTAGPSILASKFAGYDNVTYTGSGLLNTCDGKYEMLFTITVAQGSFGSYGFEFIKN